MEQKKRRGLFLVIDGIDGTGKTTQVERIKNRLQKAGHEVCVADFPRYGEKSAGPVELYLTGEMGSAEDVGPYRASVLYAVDRYLFSPQINDWLEKGYVILSNRYVASNLGHQGGKISDAKKRDEFWKWALWFEHEFFGIPRPDKNLILSADPDVAYELVAQKGDRAYLKGKKRDIHEKDIEHLRKSSESYLALAENFPDDFEVINCSPRGEMLSREEISELLFKRIKPLLPNKERR